MDIVDTGYENVYERSIQNTYAVQKKSNQEVDDDLIEMNEDLGLACEKLPEGVTIDMLWKIV